MNKEPNQEGPVRVRKLISPPLVSFSGEPATPVTSGSEAQKLATKEERMRELYRRAAATSLWVLNLSEEEETSLRQYREFGGRSPSAKPGTQQATTLEATFD